MQIQFSQEDLNKYLSWIKSGEGYVVCGNYFITHHFNFPFVVADYMSKYFGYKILVCYPNEKKVSYPSIAKFIVGDWDSPTKIRCFVSGKILVSESNL